MTINQKYTFKCHGLDKILADLTNISKAKE